MAESADPIKYGQGGARKSTISDLTKKKEELEDARRKVFLREQIIFFLIVGVSITPFILAFMQDNSKAGYQYFKLGGMLLVGLYPSYLVLRFLVSMATKKKKTEK